MALLAEVERVLDSYLRAVDSAVPGLIGSSETAALSWSGRAIADLSDDNG